MSNGNANEFAGVAAGNYGRFLHTTIDIFIGILYVPIVQCGACYIGLPDYLQMSHFVGGHNDATKSTGILNDGHTVHLLQSLVHHARAADIGKACGTTKKQKMLTN